MYILWYTHTCTLVDATLSKVSNTVMWLCTTAGILFNIVLGNMDLSGWVDSYQSIYCTSQNTEQKFRRFSNLRLICIPLPHSASCKVHHAFEHISM